MRVAAGLQLALSVAWEERVEVEVGKEEGLPLPVRSVLAVVKGESVALPLMPPEGRLVGESRGEKEREVQEETLGEGVRVAARGVKEGSGVGVVGGEGLALRVGRGVEEGCMGVAVGWGEWEVEGELVALLLGPAGEALVLWVWVEEEEGAGGEGVALPLPRAPLALPCRDALDSALAVPLPATALSVRDGVGVAEMDRLALVLGVKEGVREAREVGLAMEEGVNKGEVVAEGQEEMEVVLDGDPLAHALAVFHATVTLGEGVLLGEAQGVAGDEGVVALEAEAQAEAALLGEGCMEGEVEGEGRGVGDGESVGDPEAETLGVVELEALGECVAEGVRESTGEGLPLALPEPVPPCTNTPGAAVALGPSVAFPFPPPHAAATCQHWQCQWAAGACACLGVWQCPGQRRWRLQCAWR